MAAFTTTAVAGIAENMLGPEKEAKAEVQKSLRFLDSGFRRNDTTGYFLSFYGAVEAEQE